MKGIATARSTLAFGDFGLKAWSPLGDEPPDRGRARRALQELKRRGKVWIRVFPTSQ